ncbi:hypothetical protein K8M07_10445 [Schnuerera sp. xch1]|uniref:hypothetical protein n=1 Tax=Schnuerera sp. xch1 TaxID=2874283 RepID=UPI001CC1B131|nr:hypothetical protein [Schnuerera sp. xch1]MBZ2175655.1 hypothetical protein [Schnuerera sp. xch1]
MWTAVYLATGLDAAQKIEKALKEEGFLVKLKLFCKEDDQDLYEVLIPEFEADEIQAVLFDLEII